MQLQSMRVRVRGRVSVRVRVRVTVRVRLRVRVRVRVKDFAFRCPCSTKGDTRRLKRRRLCIMELLLVCALKSCNSSRPVGTFPPPALHRYSICALFVFVSCLSATLEIYSRYA